MIVKWSLSIGFAGAGIEGEVELDDSLTEEEIDEELKEVVFDYVEWYWEKQESPEINAIK